MEKYVDVAQTFFKGLLSNNVLIQNPSLSASPNPPIPKSCLIFSKPIPYPSQGNDFVVDHLLFTAKECTKTQSIRYTDGKIFQGTFLAEEDVWIPHGKGRLIHPWKWEYNGEFYYGKMRGKGILKILTVNDYGVLEISRQYEGGFCCNTFHGHGKFTIAEGVEYKGFWDHGEVWGDLIETRTEKYTEDGKLVLKECHEKIFISKGVPMDTSMIELEIINAQMLEDEKSTEMKNRDERSAYLIEHLGRTPIEKWPNFKTNTTTQLPLQLMTRGQENSVRLGLNERNLEMERLHTDEAKAFRNLQRTQGFSRGGWSEDQWLHAIR